MFIADDNAATKDKVTSLSQAFGRRGAIDKGDIEASRLPEPLAMLWVGYGVCNKHWTHGFSLPGQKH